jgi:hypothetical protein
MLEPKLSIAVLLEYRNELMAKVILLYHLVNCLPRLRTEGLKDESNLVNVVRFTQLE